MSKIICDICGSSYPDTAESCPICGYARDMEIDLEEEDLLEETVKRGGRFGPNKKKEIFDFDEVNSPEGEIEDEEEEEYEDEEEEEEESSGPNTFVVILLTILIAGLLLAAGFIYLRYFLPNKGGEESLQTSPAQAVEETALPAVTEETIPCDTLVMGSAAVANLNAPGQMFLLNIKAIPENTTDKILYTSADESIATVSEDGRITAVAEGETTIYIACGRCTQECRVVVKYVEETEAPTETAAATQPAEAVPQETQAELSAQTPAEGEGTSKPVDSNIKLKLKKTDIRLGVYYQYTLELDCDLEQNEVAWSSEHPHIAKVDENGVVTAVKWGTTSITAKYGDQTVSCIVRCS